MVGSHASFTYLGFDPPCTFTARSVGHKVSTNIVAHVYLLIGKSFQFCVAFVACQTSTTENLKLAAQSDVEEDERAYCGS